MHYQVQWIKSHQGHQCPIILQYVNGPCPLLAIVNILLLKRVVTLQPGTAEITFEALCGLLRTYLQSQVEKIVLDGKSDEVRVANTLKNLEDVLQLLPKLEQGLDINVKFHSPTAYEFTNELNLFDLCGVRLVHGWMYDMQDEKTSRVIGQLSYNEILDYLTMEPMNVKEAAKADAMLTVADHPPPPATAPAAATATAPPSDSSSAATVASIDLSSMSIADSSSSSSSSIVPVSAAPTADSSAPHAAKALSAAPVASMSDEEKSRKLIASLEDRAIVSQFLDETKGQLTIAGLAALHEVMKDEELAVFFRNNHFAVVLKHNTRLYTLVTDSGFVAAAPYIVWAYLSDNSGDQLHLDHDFKIPHPTTVDYYARQNQRPPPVQSPPSNVAHAHAPTPSPMSQPPAQQYPGAPPASNPFAASSSLPVPAASSSSRSPSPSASRSSIASPASSPAPLTAGELLAQQQRLASDMGMVWNQATQNYELPPQQQQSQSQRHSESHSSHAQRHTQKRQEQIDRRMKRGGGEGNEKEKKKGDSCTIQ